MDSRPVVVPLCFSCVHYRGETAAGYKCTAFPLDIPTPILLMEHDHRQPYPNDRGIRYERDPSSKL